MLTPIYSASTFLKEAIILSQGGWFLSVTILAIQHEVLSISWQEYDFTCQIVCFINDFLSLLDQNRRPQGLNLMGIGEDKQSALN